MAAPNGNAWTSTSTAGVDIADSLSAPLPG
jgi:hypothetical protein